jgi:F0F1-type ATP synthase assembly protein I
MVRCLERTLMNPRIRQMVSAVVYIISCRTSSSGISGSFTTVFSKALAWLFAWRSAKRFTASFTLVSGVGS